MKTKYLFFVLIFGLLFNCTRHMKKVPPTPPGVSLEIREKKAENLVSDGIELYQNTHYTAAIVKWKDALKTLKNDAEVHNFVGLAYHRTGDLDSAIVYYRKAVELDSGYSQAWNNLGYMYFLKSDYQQALRYFKQALKANPNYAQAKLNLEKAQEIADGKLPLKTFELFEKTTVNDSLEEQIKNYRRILGLDSNYVDAWNNLGVSYFYYGNMDSAVYCLKRALDINPEYSPAHNNAGYILDGLQKYDQAISHYQKAIRLRPDYLIALANLVDSYVHKKDYSSAKEILDALRANYPENILVKERYRDYQKILYQ